MKRLRLTLATLVAVAAIALAGSASAGQGPTPPPTDTECIGYGHEADCTGDKWVEPQIIMFGIGVYVLMFIMYKRGGRQ